MKSTASNLILLFVLLISIPTQGQIIASKSISIQAAVLDFSSKWLNNPGENNKRLSSMSQIEFSAPLSRYFSPYIGLGLGHMKNLAPEYLKETGSDFTRLSFGIILNPNNGFFFLSDKPKTIEPYALIGYQFDWIEQNKEVGYKSSVGSMGFGAGCWISIAPQLNIGYRYTLNQKLGQDYRSFNQHTFGVLIGLEKQ